MYLYLKKKMWSLIFEQKWPHAVWPDMSIPLNYFPLFIISFSPLYYNSFYYFSILFCNFTTTALSILLQEQTGLVLKKTGVSIILSSLCNVLAFFCAAIIPIPALRILSLQAAILLLFNLVSMILVFPAIVSLDLRRRR